MLRRIILISVLCTGGVATAQPHNQDILVGITGSLLRLGTQGVVNTIGTYSTFRITSVASDTDNRFAVVTHVNVFGGLPNDVLRIDLATGAIVGTVWSGPPFVGPLEAIEVDQNGDYIVLDPGRGFPQNISLFRVDRTGGAVTTITTLSGFSTDDFVEDKTTGDYFITDSSSKIRQIDRDTGVLTNTYTVASGLVEGIEQDPHNSDLYVIGRSNESVIRVDPATGTAQTMTTGFLSSAITINRAPAPDGAIILIADQGGVVRRVTRSGIEAVTRGNVPSRAWGVTFRKSRNVSPVLTAPPNDRQIVIDFPDQPNKPFLCAFSLSGYTNGLKLPDGRVVPLRIDGLTLLTAQGALPPLVTNNIGVLSATGRSVVRLNANPLGGAVSKIRVWIAAITIDPAAPSGIGRVSHPTLIVL